MSSAKMPMMTALGADWWNDSGSPKELGEAVSFGASGGTSNPVIVYQAIKSAPDMWLPVLDKTIADNPTSTEDEITWKLIHELGRKAAPELMPVYNASKGAKGFLSMQTNPKFYMNPELMVKQAEQLAALSPNIAIKAPATAAGVTAMEEMTARGIRINATVSFTVPQAVAIGEAVERGLKRAKNPDSIRPYVTLMVGRVDDHIKRVVEKEKLALTPETISWAGIAVFKAAHRIFKQRGYRATLLAAAFRHQGHWSELIGKDVLQTIPYSWWTKFNVGEHVPTLTIDNPVDPKILAELNKLPEFVKAHDEKGLTPAQFTGYGATTATLQQFLGGYADLVALVRARMLP